jgi:4-amino-4-deoxy-L-arabinose transferase-like glycosyltransferase
MTAETVVGGTPTDTATLPRAGVRPDLRWLAGLFALALSLRLGFVLAIDRPVLSGVEGLPFNDMLYYHATAKALSEGMGFIGFNGEPTARWPPMFPFLLSLVYRVAGPEPAAGEIFNAVVSALTVPLVYLIGLRSFGHSVARVAGVLAALMPGQILLAEGLLAESLYAFVLVGLFALLVWLPDRRWSAVAFGLAIGLAALTRGEGMLLLVLAPVVWWGRMSGRELWLRTGVALVAALLVVTPWVVRNSLALDTTVGISTNSAQTFWSGHNPTAYGGPSYPDGELLERIEALPAKGFDVAQAELLRDEALDWMVHHPLDELALIPRKLLYLGLGDSRAIGVGRSAIERERLTGAPATGGITPTIVESPRIAVALGTIADVAWGGLLTLTVLALALLWRRLWSVPATRATIVVLGLTLVLYGVVFYGNFRYRMPLEPLMMLLVAPLLTGLWRARRQLAAA